MKEGWVQVLTEEAWLLTYDIGDPRRLRQIEKIAKTYGVRLQRSVYLCAIREENLKEMVAQLRLRMDFLVDDVRIYHLPKGTTIGQNHPSRFPCGLTVSAAGLTL